LLHQHVYSCLIMLSNSTSTLFTTYGDDAVMLLKHILMLM
jgi:hypothetical protein